MSQGPPTNEGPPTADRAAAPEADDEGRWRTSLAVPVLIVAIAVGLIGAIIWIARDEQDAGAGALAGTTVDGPLPVTVPYRDVGGAIVIDVTFGDDGRTLPMVLDTGAPTIISEDLAATFAGETVGTIAGASADGQVVTSDVVQLAQLRIGEAVFREVGAVIGAIEPGNPFYCLTEGGFIGASLMQAASWRIDPAAGTVTIAASVDDLETTGAARLDFARSSDVSPSPLFELGVGQGSLAFVADTGADGWLAVHPVDLDGLGLEATGSVPTLSVLGTSSAGSFTTRLSWLDVPVMVDGSAVTNRLAASEILPQGQGIAGTDFLRHFALTIAWDEDALYLDPLASSAELVPTAPLSAGLGWDDGYVVGSYIEEMPENEGLVLGARVTAVDGADVTRAPFDDYCTRVVRGGGAGTRELIVEGEPPLTVPVTPVEDFFEAAP